MQVVNLTVHTFDFAKYSDFLEIYDGRLSASPMLGRYGRRNIASGSWISSGRSMVLRMTTDGYHTNKGFMATWKALCEYHFFIR